MHRVSWPMVLCATVALIGAMKPGFAADAHAGASTRHDLRRLEKSFWINATLAAPRLGYWGTNYSAAARPTDAEIANAARVLCDNTGVNRLYLIHHREVPVEEARAIFRAWRKSCPSSVELVPTLLLRMYDKEKTEVFSPVELEVLCGFFKKEINGRNVAVYDVLPGREQGGGLAVLARIFPGGIIRVGLQPDEALRAPFTSAVEDTWSAFCHGLTNDDWRTEGFGRDTLRRWVSARNGAEAIAYDLIVVAWDYSNTKRGEYPGYDDANKNLPLPTGRNALAASEILTIAQSEKLAGFSSDLLILELNSESAPHDGSRESFYETLKAGRPYAGFYAAPWREVLAIFKSLSRGELPEPPASH